MHPNELLLQNNKLLLPPGQSIQISLGKLPKYKFLYRFYVHSTLGNSGVIEVATLHQSQNSNKQSFIFNNLVTECEFTFNNITFSEPALLVFTLKKGDAISLNLPVSPILIQDIPDQQAFLFGLDEKINARISELENNTHQTIHHNLSSEVHNSHVLKNLDLKEIESFINARYFRGFISLEDSERQLDYVVYNKLFQPDGTQGFNKYKRKLYRKTLINFYRLITKNRPRKQYFAKLYRNYVNANTLTENFYNR